MKKFFLFLTLLTLSVGQMWGAEIYKNEGANGTAGGITVSGNVNTNSSNGNPGNSLANTTASNKTFTFTGFSVSGYGALKLSIDAAFKNFPSTTNTYPYATVTFYKNNAVVKTDNTTIKWTSKVNTYSTKTIENIPDFDKIEIVGSPAIGKTGKGAAATNYGLYMDNITLTGCPNPTSLTNGTITSSIAQLSWSDADDVGSYEVYRSTTNTAPAANATPTTTVTTKSVTFESLNENTTYYWWVRTKCSNTEKSAWVAGTSFTTPAAASCSNQVTLEKGSTANGTFDLDQADGSYDNCELNFVVHVSNIVPASNAQYCNGINATGGSSNVTGPVDGVWTVTYTKGNNITSVITPTYANKTAASISFENAGTPAPTTSGYYVDDSYTLPSSNNYSCSGGKTFVGWSTVPVASQNSKPSSNFYEPGESVTLGASQTFYAVFATDAGGSTEDEWVETAISSLTSSDIFVLSDGSYAFTNDNGTSAAPSAVAITIASSKITSTVNVNMKWNISGNGTDGYVFYPNGSTTTWLYCSTTNATGSNNNIRVGDGARKYFVLDEAGDLVTNDTYADRYLRNYSNSDLRGYVNKDYGTAVAPHCYRFVEGSQSYIDYSTNCCTELASINGSFFWSTLFEPLIPDKFRSHVLLCNHLFSSSHHRIPPHLIYTMYISRDFGFF